MIGLPQGLRMRPGAVAANNQSGSGIGAATVVGFLVQLFT